MLTKLIYQIADGLLKDGLSGARIFLDISEFFYWTFSHSFYFEVFTLLMGIKELLNLKMELNFFYLY